MDVQSQLAKIKKKCPEGFVLLVGSKADLRFQQERSEDPVQTEDAERLATSLGLLYIEVSGKTRKNIDLLLKIMRIRTSHLLRKNPRFKQIIGKVVNSQQQLPQQQQQKKYYDQQYSTQQKYQTATNNLLAMLQKQGENSPQKGQSLQTQYINLQEKYQLKDQKPYQEQKVPENLKSQINSKFTQEDIKKDTLNKKQNTNSQPQRQILEQKDINMQNKKNLQKEMQISEENLQQKDFKQQNYNQNDKIKQQIQTLEQIQSVSQSKKREINQNASVTIDSPDLSMNYEQIQNEFITPQFQENTKQIGVHNSNEGTEIQPEQKQDQKRDEKPVIFYQELDQKNSKVLLKLQINLGQHVCFQFQGIVMLDVFKDSNSSTLATQALKYVPQAIRSDLCKELSTLIQMKIASFCHKVSKNKSLVLSKEENTNVALGQVEVDLEGGKKAILEVHKGDNIPQLVSKFCQYYRLKPGSEEELINAAYTLL